MVTYEWGEFVYAPPTARTGELIIPPADEAHHLFRVRRIESGGDIYVTDGEGMVYNCRALPDHTLRILEALPGFGEPARPLHLCAAILKGDANREVVDTATQLGASGIVLFRAQRSEGRLYEDKLEKLRRIAITAIKQCGRACLPKITLADSLDAALTSLPAECVRFIAHPFADAPERSEIGVTLGNRCAAVIVGPEGGFTETEVNAALSAHCRPLVLARRRLRAETAVAAGLTFLLTWRGELEGKG
jgi:16S rRNA (uracil1498-N3)-methyltransferase